MDKAESKEAGNFIKTIIENDLDQGSYGGKVLTRFPPEPNGYLHIGHAKSICLNFGIAEKYVGGKCNLRFDDTNPSKESSEYSDAIVADVKWLGFSWPGEIKNASDYYEKFFQYAVDLIRLGHAFVCDLSAEEIRETRGTLSEPGTNSPFRDRSIEENLDLFLKMRAGEFADGSKLLRAKIDMSAGNVNMRDPAIYRIRRVRHHRTKDAWCIYPMYDFAHCLSDYIEGITHSLCTLEFQDHRPLYDWFLERLTSGQRPFQHEFARLNLNYTVTSKRKLKQLVDQNAVSGWDDPRMPTIVGLRRRGYTPLAIRKFCERIGVSKKETTIDMSFLEQALRDDLNDHAPRAMAVLDPIKVTIANYPDNETLELELSAHPSREDLGTRKVQFSREIFIDREDFSEDPPPKYHRLSPGKEVRLRNAFIIKCDEVKKDENGDITELICSYDPDTLGKKPERRKVKGIIHWVCAKSSLPATVKLYDRLFSVENPSASEKEGIPFTSHLNPNSLMLLKTSRVEASLAKAKAGDSFQFERQGYFSVDPDSRQDLLIFNRAVTLRDSWK